MSGNINITFSDESKQQAFEKESALKKEQCKNGEEAKSFFGEYATYYQEGYFDKEGNIQVGLFREYAQDIVMKLVDVKETSTKIRQYYNVVNDFYQSSKNPGKEKLYIMLAKAQYDLGRKKMTQVFYDFLRINTDIVLEEQLGGSKDKSEKFRVFKKHFEAVLAYAKGELRD